MKTRRRRCTISRVEFKHGWQHGPRLVIEENDEYQNGQATKTTTIPMKDEWAAMAMLEQSRAAVQYHIEQKKRELKTLEDCLAGR